MAEDIRINIKADGADTAERNLDKVGKAVDDVGDKSKRANPKLQNLTNTLLSLDQISNIIGRLKDFGIEIAEVADEFNLMQAKLQLVTEGTEEFNKAQEEVISIANEARVPLDATTDLYTKIARATKSAGIEGVNLAEITSTVSKALKVSGATTAESTSTILQLGQALASGVLRGEEFNSISENGSRIAQALAKSLGVTTGQLRQMAKDGKLTTDVVLKALADQAGNINKEFKQMPVTLSDSMTLIKNSLAEVVGQFDDATNASTNLAEALADFAKLIPQVDKYMTALGGITAGALAKMEKAWVDYAGVMRQMEAMITFGEYSDKMQASADAMAKRSAELSLEIQEHQRNTANILMDAHNEIKQSNESVTESNKEVTKSFIEFNGKVVEIPNSVDKAKTKLAEINGKAIQVADNFKKASGVIGTFNGKAITAGHSAKLASGGIKKASDSLDGLGDGFKKTANTSDEATKVIVNNMKTIQGETEQAIKSLWALDNERRKQMIAETSMLNDRVDSNRVYTKSLREQASAYGYNIDQIQTLVQNTGYLDTALAVAKENTKNMTRGIVNATRNGVAFEAMMRQAYDATLKFAEANNIASDTL